MGRKPCCEKVGLRRGPWTSEEDQKLVSHITNNGLSCWRAIPKLAGLLRCGKSCRLRWTNYLRPDLKRGIFSEAEENLILDLHATLGNRWSRIAAQLPGRTDNEIKNYWNTRLKKRLRSQGLDPNTHLPLEDSKLDDTEDDTDDEGGDSSDVTMSDASKSEKRSKKKSKPKETVKVRQPKGPKPAPQLKMCQSDEGPVLLKVPKAPKSPISVNPGPGCNYDDDSEHSSSSTVTTKSHEDHRDSSDFIKALTSVSSFPEAELWSCIKPITNSFSSTALLSEWDSYRAFDSSLFPSSYPQLDSGLPKLEDVNSKSSAVASPVQGMLPAYNPMGMEMQTRMQFSSQLTHEIGQNYGGIFQETCYPQPDMGMSWSMHAELSHCGTESLFATPNPANAPSNFEEVPQPSPCTTSQELQRLAALLDLI